MTDFEEVLLNYKDSHPEVVKAKENLFKLDLENLINKHSKENLSNTPDYILADYINSCLYIFETATLARDMFNQNRKDAGL